MTVPQATGYRYLACHDCGLGRIDPIPRPAVTVGESGPAGIDGPESYDEGYFRDGGARAGYADYAADERWHRHTARARLRRISVQLSRAESGQGAGRINRSTGAGRQGTTAPCLVDVGTALGFMPDEARRQGWQAVAVEHSTWAAERARGLGLRVEPSLADLDDLAGGVDVVSFFQVLEHMPEPVEAMADALRLLRPGGIVICETWDFASRTARLMGARWQQLSPPSVLWLLTPDCTARIVREVGLEPVSWRRSAKLVSAATVTAQTISMSGRLAELVRRLHPVIARIPLPYALDDLVTFVARKPPG